MKPALAPENGDEWSGRPGGVGGLGSEPSFWMLDTAMQSCSFDASGQSPGRRPTETLTLQQRNPKTYTLFQIEA